MKFHMKLQSHTGPGNWSLGKLSQYPMLAATTKSHTVTVHLHPDLKYQHHEDGTISIPDGTFALTVDPDGEWVIIPSDSREDNRTLYIFGITMDEGKLSLDLANTSVEVHNRIRYGASYMVSEENPPRTDIDVAALLAPGEQIIIAFKHDNDREQDVVMVGTTPTGGGEIDFIEYPPEVWEAYTTVPNLSPNSLTLL